MTKTTPKDIAKVKADLRSSMIERRAALTETQRKEKAEKISKAFIGNMPLNRGDKIACYWPMPGEVDIKILIEILIEEGYMVCLPVTQGKDKPLIFRRYNKGDNLAKQMGLNVQGPSEFAPEITPNIVVVPLIAFDDKGYRLGFGGGYYDRTIEKLKKKSDIMFAGVGYAFQQVKNIPKEKHDERLDCIITEKGITISQT